MKLKFDKEVFKKWLELNGLNRSKVITDIGQRDPNKVGRWLTGQTIGTEDLLALCNTYNLQISDFLITVDDQDDSRIETLLPESIKEKRANNTTCQPIKETIATQPLEPDDLKIARLALQYEQKINKIIQDHSAEMRESRQVTRRQMETRTKMVETLQESIASLTKTIEAQRATIQELQQVNASQQNVINTYDAIIRKQKKMPPQPSYQTFTPGSSVTMASDGGPAISATTPPAHE